MNIEHRPRRFNLEDFAIGAPGADARATVLDLDRIDPAAVPILMDAILTGRKVWGPWRDSPLRIPARGFVLLGGLAVLGLLPRSIGNIMELVVDPNAAPNPWTVVAFSVAIAVLPVLLWLIFVEGGVTGADAAISLSVTAADGDDEAVDRIRSRWADVQKMPGVPEDDLSRVRTLAYNAQCEAAFHVHMRSAGEDAAQLRDLAKTRDAAMEIFEAEVDRLQSAADRRRRTAQLEAQIRAAAQIAAARTSGLAPVGPEPAGNLSDHAEPVGDAHSTEPVTRYEQPPLALHNEHGPTIEGRPSPR